MFPFLKMPINKKSSGIQSRLEYFNEKQEKHVRRSLHPAEGLLTDNEWLSKARHRRRPPQQMGSTKNWNHIRSTEKKFNGNLRRPKLNKEALDKSLERYLKEDSTMM